MTRQEKIDAICDKVGSVCPHLHAVLKCYKELPHAEIYTDNSKVIENMRKEIGSIYHQDDECIDFIYGLLCGGS